MTSIRFSNRRIHAYTSESSTLERQLGTFARFCGYVSPEDENSTPPPMHEFRGIWDTGATNTVLSGRVAAKMGLSPYRVTKTATASHVIECPVYMISLLLPLNVFIFNVPVTAMEFPEPDIDFLLGMDIIHLGDFAITHSKDRTKYTFQIPSTHDIDFREEIDARHNEPE
ncbi:MAG: retroviral-like aspartic protease family protein [Planctomycetota bacterium]|jgi:predicted aspartyl protease|nr:retroviral-like aspartic protease family protein [Planctomycetota bacterium]